MNKLIYIVALLLMLSGSLLACGNPAASPVATKAPAGNQNAAAPAAGPTAWEKAALAGKQEGKVVIYTTLGVEVRNFFAGFFTKQYGVDIEFVTGRSAEVFAKLAAERRAGLYLGDVYVGGSSSQLQLKEAGFIVPVEPALLLPEVADKKMWEGGELLFVDRDRTILIFGSHVNIPLVINKDMVNPPIKSMKELLEPKWKGKILLDDPTQSGPGNLDMTAIGEMIGESFIRELAKQEPIIVRDKRTLIEWVARAKNPIGLGPNIEMLTEFLKAGAPIATDIPSDLTFTSSASGLVSIMDKAAHPNAATVFVNWLLSKEGQTAYMKSVGSESRRVDVTTEYTMPDQVRQPGVKYLNTESEELAAKRFYYMKLNQEVLAQLLK